MIQRKQTIWLLVASLLSVCLFYFDLYRVHVMVNNADTVMSVRVGNDYLLLLVALVTAVLPFIDIFLFKNRKQQRGLAVLSILLNIVFIALMMWKITSFNNKNATATDHTYWVGAVLPVISIIFLFMAMRGIRKDEKLVKSLDRLR
ncbi:MAG TPA: DUF4293 domain-containing protein [Flavipsychrobacter sp.]|nr:DUF4293 domain-containing protein [Flavipsychrobacter sp.]